MALSHLTGPAHFNFNIKIHVLTSLLWGTPVHIGVEISVPLKEENLLFFFFYIFKREYKFKKQKNVSK